MCPPCYTTQSVYFRIRLSCVRCYYHSVRKTPVDKYVGKRVAYSSNTKGGSSDQARWTCLAGGAPTVALKMLYICRLIGGKTFISWYWIGSSSIDGAEVCLCCWALFGDRYNTNVSKIALYIYRISLIFHFLPMQHEWANAQSCRAQLVHDKNKLQECSIG